jgi:hypothetical protein
MNGRTNSTTVHRTDAPSDASTWHSLVRTVTDGYFDDLGPRILQGRRYDARDNAGGVQVAMVNETYAAREFPGGNPLGRRIVVRGLEREIVGVFRDTHQFSRTRAPSPEVWTPYAQEYQDWMRRFMSVAVRSPRPSTDLLATLRQELRSTDSEIAVIRTRTMQSLVDRELRLPRFRSALMLAFAAVALILSAVGIGGVMAYTVSRRAPDLALRLALGARPADVKRLILGQSARLALAGVAAGLVIALVTSRFVGSLLYGVPAVDPLVFGATAVLLTGVALLASYLPARRAASVDPAATLRAE